MPNPGPRPPAGKIWVTLVIKHYLACRDANEDQRRSLFDLLDLYEESFKPQVKQELDYWLKKEAPE